VCGIIAKEKLEITAISYGLEVGLFCIGAHLPLEFLY
jgi:hypothetical protein